MTTAIIIGVLSFVTITSVYICFQLHKADKEKIKDLEKALSEQKRITAELYRHAEEIAKIANDDKKTAEAIKEAKTNEELIEIINSIVDANNERLRNI